MIICKYGFKCYNLNRFIFKYYGYPILHKMPSYTYYTKDEQKVFINHFINRPEHHAQKFSEYIKDSIAQLTINLRSPGIKYSLPNGELLYTPDKTVYDKKSTSNKHIEVPLMKIPPYDTHNKLWDEKTNNSLLQHFLGMPSFPMTNTSLKHLNYIHPNWNHVNNDNENVLFQMARNWPYEDITTPLFDFKIDTEVKNKHGHYFTWYYFSPKKIKKLFENSSRFDDFFTVIKMTTTIKDCQRVLELFPDHFRMSPKQTQDFYDMWASTKKEISKIFANPDAITSSVGNKMAEQVNLVDNLILQVCLNNEIKADSVKTKSLKI